LVRQKRLDEGEQKRQNHDDEEEHRDAVFEEHAQRRPPVGVVGIAAALGLGGVKAGKGEKLLVGKPRGRRLRRGRARDLRLFLRKLLFELLFEGAGELLGLVILVAFHQRAPSFLVKLMRGSRMAMRMSPKSRPRMEMAA